MTRLRARPVIAVAWRDLRQELKGRQGLFVPGVLVALLLPTSLYDRPEPVQANMPVTGDVPEAVLAIDHVVVRSKGRSLRFEQVDDRIRITGPALPGPIREVLDQELPEGAVRIVDEAPTQQQPHRGLFLALIAASSLTGPVASSIGTERSRHTLTALLTAAITRLEIVVGKWLAWAGFGVASTLAFAGVALARDVIEPGTWLLALAAVPASLVALGLYVVRRASDVVGATATALRLQPAALMVTALGAFTLGELHPLLGAAVPIGGALIAAGDVWVGEVVRAPLVATASSLLFTAGLLALTARDLDESPRPAPLDGGWTGAVLAAAGAAVALWTPLVGPELWRQAGNPGLTEALSPTAGALGAASALIGWTLLRAGNHTTAWSSFLDVQRPPPTAWAHAVVGGLLLGLASQAFGGFADPGTLQGALAHRLDLALLPAGLPLGGALALLVAEELFFRGVLPKQLGAGPASAAWAVVKAPLDPFGALVGGVTLGAVSARGGLLASLLARLVALGAALVLPTLPLAGAVGLGLVAVALGAATGRTR